MCLVISEIPAWGQSITVVTARQQPDAATTKTQADVAAAKAQTDAAAAKAQADAAVAKAREAERAAARQRISPEALQDLQHSLNLPNLPSLPTPFVQVNPSRGGGYNLQVNTSRTNDPLAALQVAPGTWWNNADTVTRLNLTKEQQKKMDDIFQQFRLTLIDLNAALSKEELIMDPLIAAERLDEVKILAQIDRIAQARAELEKANSRMLLAIRQSLTMEQWTKIQSSPGTFRVVGSRR
jgi:Spy/CpxP family protein refolding chaperone